MVLNGRQVKNLCKTISYLKKDGVLDKIILTSYRQAISEIESDNIFGINSNNIVCQMIFDMTT